jgi:hypothetical protein
MLAYTNNDLHALTVSPCRLDSHALRHDAPRNAGSPGAREAEEACRDEEGVRIASVSLIQLYLYALGDAIVSVYTRSRLFTNPALLHLYTFNVVSL